MPRRSGFVYFDTSVVVKRIVRESGSEMARSLLRRHRAVSSAVMPVEVISALARKRKTGEMTAQTFETIASRMRAERDYWSLIEVNADVLASAEDLVQRTPLRTLDAVHVASALAFRAGAGRQIPFGTADARQRDAAEAAGLEVLWIS
jgi:predicted nucleic acid-binding protein